MMHYILLVNYPAEARKKIRGFTKGRDLVNEEVRKLGGKITRYFTQGPYDAVVHLEVPSEKEAMRLVVYVGSLGIQTLTMRAFTEDEFIATLGTLPPE